MSLFDRIHGKGSTYTAIYEIKTPGVEGMTCECRKEQGKAF